MVELTLTSDAFSDGEDIPQKYSCDGADVNPPLEFSGVPEEAAALAVVMDDPDVPSGTWDHRVVWNIPADTGALAEDSVPGGAVQGTNDFGSIGWGGPCPPPGPAHGYVFTLYALDTALDLASGSTKAELLVDKINDWH